MATLHKETAKVFPVQPLGEELKNAHTETLAKTDDLQILRVVIHAAEQYPTHETPGPAVFQCLEGIAAVTVGDQTHRLEAGQILCLAGGECHSLEGIEDSSLLVTIFSGGKESTQCGDVVEQASEESFPASDAPSWTPTTTLGGPTHDEAGFSN